MKKKTSKTVIKSLGLLCSGGDAPGMNPAIRAIVRTGLGLGLKVWGIKRGYAGLIEGDMDLMKVSDVGNIIQRGGTILQTSRCPEFLQEKSRAEAGAILKKNKVDGLIVIGGDGSFNGAMSFANETGIPVIGVPGTIDNDISGTEYTIGFDTAVQNAIEAVDKIRDTASSHARIFLVEVMGRNSPAIALEVGVCTGAENIIFPGKKTNYSQIVKDIRRGIERGKNSSIIIVAEGPQAGFGYEVHNILKKDHGLSSHVAILGYIQRGGPPSAYDRFIASQMGALSVEALVTGKFPTVTTMNQGSVGLTPLKDCLKKRSLQGTEILDLVKKLSI